WQPPKSPRLQRLIGACRGGYWTVLMCWLPLAVTAVTFAGRYFIYHNFALSMDEYGAEFQATIFASGHVMGQVPLEWQPYAKAITPIFVTYNPTAHSWVTAYWPVFSFLLAPFQLLGLPGLLNPLLAGGSVALVAAVARQMFGDECDIEFAN